MYITYTHICIHQIVQTIYNLFFLLLALRRGLGTSWVLNIYLLNKWANIISTSLNFFYGIIFHSCIELHCVNDCALSNQALESWGGIRPWGDTQMPRAGPPQQRGVCCPAAGSTGKPSLHCQLPSGIVSATESHLPRAPIPKTGHREAQCRTTWAGHLLLELSGWREGGAWDFPPAWQFVFSVCSILFLPSPSKGVNRKGIP